MNTEATPATTGIMGLVIAKVPDVTAVVSLEVATVRVYVPAVAVLVTPEVM